MGAATQVTATAAKSACADWGLGVTVEEWQSVGSGGGSGLDDDGDGAVAQRAGALWVWGTADRQRPRCTKPLTRAR